MALSNLPNLRQVEYRNDALRHFRDAGQEDNIAVGAACNKSSDYVRLLHVVPNEYNYGKTPAGKSVDEEADNELVVFEANDELRGFQERHGMTLEEWANFTFRQQVRVI
ncbi:hypothetical protein [Paenibacillus sp. HB172176]|uniref:hypothetical protein n=1 Tax=Paenibacillus sp. HB172176 TaxID=2493690 RepID=UPI00143CAD31|nr:hypothetical protein [Paenibacillus sp. HB172176]